MKKAVRWIRYIRQSTFLIRFLVKYAYGCIYIHKFIRIFSVCAPPPPPPQYVMLPPVTEHVSLHSKSLCKNIARASGGCK